MTFKVGCLVALAGVAAGCSSLGAPRSEVSAHIPLATDSLLALTANAVLIRAGEGFVLAGLDGQTVRWGRLNSDGLLIGESQFALPESPAVMPDGRALGPVFAVTQKNEPGDQLVTAMLVQKVDSQNTFEVHAYVHDQQSSAAPSLHVLGDMVASAQSGSIRVVAGSPVSGKTALVLWGIGGQAAPINYQMLGTDGAPLGGVQKLLDSEDASKIPRWDCVDVSQNLNSFAITLVEDASAGSSMPLWHRYNLFDDGTSQGEALIYLRWGQVADCRITSSPTPLPDGYLVAWQNSKSSGGTYFAHMSPPLPDAGADEQPEVTSRHIVASETYGGYSRMPKLLWSAPVGAGTEFTVGMLGSKGPEVMRFDLLADPKGGTLHLPSSAGNVGPVSSWVGPDATWVTYLDMPAAQTGSMATTGSVRLLVKVTPTVTN
jgi:hypothetical protein